MYFPTLFKAFPLPFRHISMAEALMPARMKIRACDKLR